MYPIRPNLVGPLPSVFWERLSISTGSRESVAWVPKTATEMSLGVACLASLTQANILQPPHFLANGHC